SAAMLVLLLMPSASGSDVPDPATDRLLLASGFLDHHPDLRYRTLALEEYGKKNNAEAYRLFQRAAYYADKPSQAIVGEMLWAGVGVTQDRPRAYAWMDVAAERDYITFRTKRDAYWTALDEAERAAALTALEEIRMEYGDAVAEKRLASALRRGRAQMSGSRVGSQANPVQIVVPGYGSIDGSKFYDSRYWDPAEYRGWHDAYWKDLRFGRVDVGDVQTIEAGQGPDEDKPTSRPVLPTDQNP